MSWGNKRQKHKLLPKSKKAQREIIGTSIEDFLRKKEEGEIEKVKSGFSGEKAEKIRKDKERYENYVKKESSEWVSKKKWALKARGAKCEICHDIGNEKRNPLQVHHNNYQWLCHERLEDLAILCNACHYAFHEKVPGRSLQTRQNRGDCSVCSSGKKKNLSITFVGENEIEFNLCVRCQDIFEGKISNEFALKEIRDRKLRDEKKKDRVLVKRREKDR